MGCGCKNKQGNQQASTPNQAARPQAQAQKNQNVQESVKKIVEKYYNKK
jgi:hypothetical protein